MKLVALAVLATVALTVPRVAHAERGTLIALLPLAADARLKIYGQPVASELARRLEQDGFAIVVVTSTAPVPSKARLVIDGRIVRGDGDEVLIEARVRDPAAGKVVAELSASAPSLTRIDEAAADLAGRLSPILTDGLARQHKPARLTTKGGTGDGAVTEGTASTDPTEPVAPTKKDARPLAVVSVVALTALGPDDPELAPLLRTGAIRLAGLVGHRAEDLRGSGELEAALAEQHAAIAVSIEILTMDYDDGGVVTARARGRVRVVDASGVVFSRVVRTDTLVGGRGDRRDAVARAAIDQIVDVAMPRVRENLAARTVTP